ncbi:Zinc finger A20 and AN1 domain-containing stress-associated protein 8 [Linum perenne]
MNKVSAQLSTKKVDRGGGGGGAPRCSACKKRVGLTGFNCRCGELFCGVHRYSDRHDCCYDYKTAARVLIAECNPVVKGLKLHAV